MSQLRTPPAMHVLGSGSVLTHSQLHLSAVQTVTLHPGAVTLMIIRFGKAGYALSVQEHKVTLYGAKNKHLCS